MKSLFVDEMYRDSRRLEREPLIRCRHNPDYHQIRQVTENTKVDPPEHEEDWFHLGRKEEPDVSHEPPD